MSDRDRDGSVEGTIEPDLFNLDKHRLDEEWVEQVKEFRLLSGQLADLRRDLEMAKADADVEEQDLKRTAAEVSLDVRRNPGAFGVEKLTEGVVDACVLTDGRFVDGRAMVDAKRREVVNRAHLVGLKEADVRAMDHRKKALEDLVVLQGRDYFAQPRDRTEGRDVGKGKANKAFGGPKKRA